MSRTRLATAAGAAGLPAFSSTGAVWSQENGNGGEKLAETCLHKQWVAMPLLAVQSMGHAAAGASLRPGPEAEQQRAQTATETTAKREGEATTAQETGVAAETQAQTAAMIWFLVGDVDCNGEVEITPVTGRASASTWRSARPSPLEPSWARS